MKLIVGLGNPTKEYEGTRHNVGFYCIDEIAKYYNTSFSVEASLKCMLAKVNINGNKAILIKPLTYMNLSGEAVRLVAKYYKIEVDDILIISDDLDSHTGRVRIRANGSAGGHNGLKSIALNLQTENYKRIKVGIDRSNTIPVIHYVLQKFKEEELALINQAIELIIKAVDNFIKDVDFGKISSLYSKK